MLGQEVVGSAQNYKERDAPGQRGRMKSPYLQEGTFYLRNSIAWGPLVTSNKNQPKLD